MEPTKTRAARWWAGSLALATVPLLAACGSNGASSPTSTAPRPTSTTAAPASTGTAATATTAPAPTTSTTQPAATTTTTTASSALNVAVVAYQTSQGVQPSQYQVKAESISTVDPTWGYFSVGPSSPTEDDYQGGFGYLQQSGGTWSVVDFGSSGVGRPGTRGVNVPVAVITGFGQACS